MPIQGASTRNQRSCSALSKILRDELLLPAVILSDLEGAEATEGESKDPEDVSPAMQIQGVSTRNQRWALAPAKALLLTVGFLLAISVKADTKPTVQLSVDNAGPRQVEESTQQAIMRDYSSAWQALSAAMASNSTAPLNDNFIGYALSKLTQRVRDQQQNGLKTRIVDRGHKLDAIFYSPDGSALELRDTATLETQVLDGDTVIYSDQAQVHYYAVMTGAEDRWKVRVLESADK